MSLWDEPALPARSLQSTFGIYSWRVSARAEIQVPDGHTCVFIVQKGNVRINGEAAKAVELIQFKRDDTSVTLESESLSRIVVLTGQPIEEPITGQGPFVLNTREEIRQAIQDYQSGKMEHLS